MQIIIVQAEIEAAIRAHIEQQVSIKDGMEITIDLRSTRGDAGFTANIDIVPAKNTGGAVTAQAATLISAQKNVNAMPKGEANQGKQEQPPMDNKFVQEGAEQFKQEQPAGSTDSGQSTGSTETTSTQEAGDEESDADRAARLDAEAAQTEQSAETQKPAGRSLFPNLKRISNA